MIAKPLCILDTLAAADVVSPRNNFAILDMHALNNFLAAIGRYAECLQADLAARQLETTLPESILKTLAQIEAMLLPLDQEFAPPLEEGQQPAAVHRNMDVKTRVLLIDDQADIRAATAMMLEQCGVRVVDFASVAAAMAGVDMTKIDLIISDLKLPDGWSGLELARFVSEKMGANAPPVLIVSGQNPARIAASENLPPSVKGVYKKPLSRKNLLSAIAELLEIT